MELLRFMSYWNREKSYMFLIIIEKIIFFLNRYWKSVIYEMYVKFLYLWRFIGFFFGCFDVGINLFY